jgi:hypothetical protein
MRSNDAAVATKCELDNTYKQTEGRNQSMQLELLKVAGATKCELDNTYKQTDDQNQSMQLDLLKVLPTSTFTRTPKVRGWRQKGLYLISFTVIGSLVFITRKLNHRS